MESAKPYVHHALILIIGLLLITSGAQTIYEHYNTFDLDAGSDWWQPVILISFGGMLAGVALNKLAQIYRMQRRAK